MSFKPDAPAAGDSVYEKKRLPGVEINDDWEKIESQKLSAYFQFQHQLSSSSTISQQPRTLLLSNLDSSTQFSDMKATSNSSPEVKGNVSLPAERASLENDKLERSNRSNRTLTSSGSNPSGQLGLSSHKVGDLTVCVASSFSSDDETHESSCAGLSALGSPPHVEQISSILASMMPADLINRVSDDKSRPHRPLNAFCEPVDIIKCDSMDGFTQVRLDKSILGQEQNQKFSTLCKSESLSESLSLSSSHDLDASYENVHQSLLPPETKGELDKIRVACNLSRTHAAPLVPCESTTSLTESTSTDLQFCESAIALPSSPNSRSSIPLNVSAQSEVIEHAHGHDIGLADCGSRHASKSNEFIRLPLLPTLQSCASNRDTKNSLNHPPIFHDIGTQLGDLNQDPQALKAPDCSKISSLPLPSSPPAECSAVMRAGSVETTISLNSDSSRVNYSREWSRAGSITSLDSDSRSEHHSREQSSAQGYANTRMRKLPKERHWREQYGDREYWHDDVQYRDDVGTSPRRSRHGNTLSLTSRSGHASHRPMRYRDHRKICVGHHQGSHVGIEKDRGGGAAENEQLPRSPLLRCFSYCCIIVACAFIACTIAYIAQCMVLVIYHAGKCRFEYGGEISLGIDFHPYFVALPVPAVICGAGIARLEQIIEIGTALGNTLIAREDIVLDDYYGDLEELLLEFKEMDLGEISSTEKSAHQRQRNPQHRPACDSAQAAKEFTTGEIPIACRIPIIEGLAHINDTLQTIYMTVQYFRIGVMSAAGRLARGLAIVEQQLVGDGESSRSRYFKFFDYTVPNYKLLVSAFSDHLFNEVKTIQGLAVSIYNQLEIASERADSTLGILRAQLDILLNVGENTQVNCYNLELFDIFGGKILRKLSEKLGFRICDGSEKVQAEKVSASKNITSALLLKAENQAMQAHGVIKQVLQSLHSFEMMLKKVEEKPIRFLSFYSDFYREERGKILERVRNLRNLFHEQSGERTAQLPAGSTRPLTRRPTKASKEL